MTIEQEARDLLDRLPKHIEPQDMTSGDLVELANLIRDARRYYRHISLYGDPNSPRPEYYGKSIMEWYNDPS